MGHAFAQPKVHNTACLILDKILTVRGLVWKSLLSRQGKGEQADSQLGNELAQVSPENGHVKVKFIACQVINQCYYLVIEPSGIQGKE